MPSRDEGHGVRDTAVTAMLLAVATALGYAEAVLLPSLPVPGLKLGLANVAVVIALATVGSARAGVVSVGRVFLVALATGTVGGPTMVLALSGAVASWAVMSGLARKPSEFSVIGWSLAGASAHVIGQLAAAVVITASPAAIMLLPFAMSLALMTGTVVGLISHLLLSRVPALRAGYAGG
jgi:heptaprenyl diphosphate synthase